MQYKLTTTPNNESCAGETLEQLTKQLDALSYQPYIQVWMEGDNGQTLGVFFNAECALVAWFHHDGTGAEAFKPEWASKSEAQEIYLENGQVDEYPTSLCVPKSDGVRALLDFCEQGDRPNWLAWNEH